MPVVYVDYPGPASLTQIYGTFNRAMLRLIPSLRTFAEPLTAAMVEFYTMSQVVYIKQLYALVLFFWGGEIHNTFSIMPGPWGDLQKRTE